MTGGELWAAWAVLYAGKYGFSIIPMGRDKRPLIEWKQYQDRRPSLREILGWKKENLAIVTGEVSGIAVIDCESREDAEWFWRNRSTSPMVCQTKRGYHLYFRHPNSRVRNAQRVEGRYDVRGDGGYVLAPPSQHSEGQYRWVTGPKLPSELPVFDQSWRPVVQRDETVDRKIKDGAGYISKIHAVSGESGHDATYQAACSLKESGLTQFEALLALRSWNQTNAQPPWSDGELIHKIEDAYKVQQ